jgi:hypothetical protein
MPGRCDINGVAFPLQVQGRRPQEVISELSTQPATSLSTLHRFGYPHGARLAPGWRPPLAVRDSHPKGPFGKFQKCRYHLLTHVISSPSPRLRLAYSWYLLRAAVVGRLLVGEEPVWMKHTQGGRQALRRFCSDQSTDAFGCGSFAAVGAGS